MTLCIGMVREELNYEENVFDFDLETLEENETVYTDYPIYLFMWKNKYSLFLRSKQLLCETFQGKK